MFWELESLGIANEESSVYDKFIETIDFRNNNAVVQDQLSQRIVENVEPSYPTKAKRIHYIPHQPVIRSEKSTSKLRIVYDASAKATNGLSLNTGPKFVMQVIKH